MYSNIEVKVVAMVAKQIINLLSHVDNHILTDNIIVGDKLGTNAIDVDVVITNNMHDII